MAQNEAATQISRLSSPEDRFTWKIGARPSRVKSARFTQHTD